jgi:hypothetical protein
MVKIYLSHQILPKKIFYMLYYKDINLKKLSFSHKRIPTEKTPSSFEMREALRVLRRGMQHHSSNYELNYKYEYFINDLLTIRKNRHQYIF